MSSTSDDLAKGAAESWEDIDDGWDLGDEPEIAEPEAAEPPVSELQAAHPTDASVHSKPTEEVPVVADLGFPEASDDFPPLEEANEEVDVVSDDLDLPPPEDDVPPPEPEDDVPPPEPVSAPEPVAEIEPAVAAQSIQQQSTQQQSTQQQSTQQQSTQQQSTQQQRKRRTRAKGKGKRAASPPQAQPAPVSQGTGGKKKKKKRPAHHAAEPVEKPEPKKPRPPWLVPVIVGLLAAGFLALALLARKG